MQFKRAIVDSVTYKMYKETGKFTFIYSILKEK